MSRFDYHVFTRETHLRERKLADEFRHAVASTDFAYARSRAAGGSLYVTAYHRNAKSPTGVQAAASCLDFAEAVAIMDAAGRPFPLSPTEGLTKS